MSEIIHKNWTIQGVTQHNKYAYLQVKCSCGKLHTRTFLAVKDSEGFCQDCGPENQVFRTNIFNTKALEIGSVVGDMIIESSIDRTEKTGPRKAWFARCIICKSQQQFLKTYGRISCKTCAGHFGKTFNDLTFVALGELENGARQGMFKCTCGDIFKCAVSKVSGGIKKRCLKCTNLHRVKTMEINRLALGAQNKILKEKVLMLEQQLQALKQGTKSE